IEATTTRASTVIRSMPTRETRTQASITMPLSSTRSRTSMRLVPPDARSTGMMFPPRLPSVVARGQLAPCTRRPPAEGFDLALQQPHLFTQPFVFQLVLVVAGREVMIVAPPIEADLLRLVDRADDQPDAAGEKLHLRQRDLDVARHHQAFVEDAIEHVHEPTRLVPAQLKFGSHERDPL